jgi:transposase
MVPSSLLQWGLEVNRMDEEQRTRTVMRRYAMVGPLALGDVPVGERGAFLREKSRRYRISVSTLKRYCRQYREQEVDGLKPKQGRTDKGKARKIPPEILQPAVELREADPTVSTFQLLATLERLQPQHEGKVKRSTLARLAQAIPRAKIMCVTGDIGAGKSTALRAAQHNLSPALYRFIYVPNPNMAARDLYQELLRELGVQPPWSTTNARRQLRDAFQALREDGRTPLSGAPSALLFRVSLYQLRSIRKVRPGRGWTKCSGISTD